MCVCRYSGRPCQTTSTNARTQIKCAAQTSRQTMSDHKCNRKNTNIVIDNVRSQAYACLRVILHTRLCSMFGMTVTHHIPNQQTCICNLQLACPCLLCCHLLAFWAQTLTPTEFSAAVKSYVKVNESPRWYSHCVNCKMWSMKCEWAHGNRQGSCDPQHGPNHACCVEQRLVEKMWRCEQMEQWLQV